MKAGSVASSFHNEIWLVLAERLVILFSLSWTLSIKQVAAHNGLVPEAWYSELLSSAHDLSALPIVR